ncbi:ComEA family DNA-binding protein [Gilvimarinus agarilyticus]|uniref:ComEA family DNA-binding protein n=1 Tax=Gilvimarinus agarilyticus TaxID=679259 RepID=UPI0005A06820|nr:ComEA family DNA-binding protein [Gilvimarinus agarilyticus]
MKRLISSFVIALAVTVFSPLHAFAAGPDTEASVSAPININTADVQTLSQLKGIGEAKAQAIIAWREQNGPFDSVDELLQVKGIGEATLDDIRAKVAL